MASEFDLVGRYFTRATQHTALSIGDDAALISLTAGNELAISVDMLVAGTHFFHDTDAYQLGWKSLAVNISDMAAMGATPRWATLAIALPEINEPWLAEFSNGLFTCADKFDIDLIGGDTTRGPLTISMQIMGETPSGKAIRRSGAKADDDIWVSGRLGSAALALNHLLNKTTIPADILPTCLDALHAPMPRVALGLALRGLANSCIDVSDGLMADLGHILKASNLGAAIELTSIPCHTYLHERLHDAMYQHCVLAGGDDYELVFTAAPSQRDAIIELGKKLNLPLSLIGKTTRSPDMEVSFNQQKLNLTKRGFDHFG